MTTHYKLHIQINEEENTIQISTIDIHNPKSIQYFFIDENNTVLSSKKICENYSSICFDRNEIILCLNENNSEEENHSEMKDNSQNSEKSEEENNEDNENKEENEQKKIHNTFIQDIINNPTEYQIYHIQYNNQTYQVYGELLFAFYIIQFKRIIEKNGIIKETEIELTENHKGLNLIMKRLHRSLYYASLPNNAQSKAKVILDHEEEYKNLESVVYEICEHHDEYLQNKRQLEMAKTLVNSTHYLNNNSINEINQQKQNKLNEINFNENYTQDVLYEIGLQFNTKQKEELKLYKLDNYTIFLAAKYFETIEDFINLEMAVKRFRGTLEKFHYNPISLKSKTLKFFPNVETLHLYETSDKFLTGQRIQWYCVWYVESYFESFEKNKSFPENSITWKRLSFEMDDLKEMKKREKEKQQKKDEENGFGRRYRNSYFSFDLQIPDGIVELGNKLFSKIKGKLYNEINKVIYPTSLTRLNDYAFENAFRFIVQNINETTFPNVKSLGKGCFKSFTDDVIYLPPLVKEIPEECCENSRWLRKIVFPTNVELLKKSCFDNCSKLNSIILPSTVTKLESQCFRGCSCITKIQFSENLVSIGNQCFTGCLSIQQLTLPSTLTFIGNGCFEVCKSLQNIVLPESINCIGFNCFNQCDSLTSITIGEQWKFEGDRLFITNNQTLNSLYLPSKVSVLNGKKIKLSQLKTFTIPSNITQLGEYCFANCLQLSKVVRLDKIQEIGTGCFHNCPKMTKEKNKKFETDSERDFNIDSTIIDQIQEWSQSKISETLFDSNVESWTFDQTALTKKLKGRGKLIVLIETETNIFMGGYIEQPLNCIGQYIFDNNAFIFTFKDNKPMKFDIQQPQFAFKLCNKTNKYILILGYNDIRLRRGKEQSNCWRKSTSHWKNEISTYNYNGIKNALCGNSSFHTKRLLIFQMK